MILISLYVILDSACDGDNNMSFGFGHGNCLQLSKLPPLLTLTLTLTGSVELTDGVFFKLKLFSSREFPWIMDSNRDV